MSMEISQNTAFYEKLLEAQVPVHVQMEVTSRCNVECIHCIRELCHGGELTLEQIKDIITQLAEAGCMQLTLTGGEPLMRKDFWDICEFARSKGIALRIFTNATMITEKIAQRMAEMKFIEVRITLFSLDEEIHDKIMASKGSLKRALKGIGFLEKYKLPFRIGSMILRENARHLESLRDEAYRRNWTITFQYNLYQTYIGQPHPFSNRISDADVKYLGEQDIMYPATYETPEAKKLVLDTFYLGKLHCYISANGRVFPHATIRFEVGDLRQSSFKDIWENSENLNWLRNLKINEFECANCEHHLNCHWALGIAYPEHGRMTAMPKDSCRIIEILKSEVYYELQEQN